MDYIINILKRSGPKLYKSQWLSDAGEVIFLFSDSSNIQKQHSFTI